MNEIPTILEAREKVIWEGKPKYAPYIFSTFLGSLFIGAFLGLFAGMFLSSFILGITATFVIFVLAFVFASLSYKFTHYALTNRRAIFQSGIFGRNFKLVNYDDVQNASVSVGLINWIFGTGTVSIYTGEVGSTGGKNPRMVSVYDSISYIDNAYDVLKELQEHTTEMEENLYGGKNVIQRVKLTK